MRSSGAAETIDGISRAPWKKGITGNGGADGHAIAPNAWPSDQRDRRAPLADELREDDVGERRGDHGGQERFEVFEAAAMRNLDRAHSA